VQVLGSLRMLLLMKPDVIHSVSRHVAYGLHDLLKTNAASIHAAYDWCTLFTLLEVVGAGSNPPPLMQVRPGVDVSQVVMDAGVCSLLMMIGFHSYHIWHVRLGDFTF